MDYKKHFKGKKVTLMGLGLLGRGLNDAIFLAQCGAKLTITDLRDKKTLKPSLEKLKKYKNISYTLGEHKLEDFENKDFILKAAGVPLDSEFISHARQNGVPIEMDASLFAKLASGVHLIGITGTRGKTTTTSLIYEIAKKFFKKQKVFLAGNIRDTATLPLLKKVKKGDIVVLELDSWQLQGFGEAKISPHIAVFTNFMNDHLNYYKGDLDAYLEDKAQIFLHQKQNDYLIATPKAAHLLTAKYFGLLRHDPIVASKDDVPTDWDIKIEGEHNKDNIGLAMKVAEILHIPKNTVKKAVEGFAAVEGRLEFIKEKKGVKIYNDNNSTTPDATIAALKALAASEKNSERNIILIAGGADKNLTLERLIDEMNKTCKKVVLLPGTGTEKLLSQNAKIKVEMENAKDLKDAVTKASKLAKAGDTILFSPAFASFGLFKNEYDRNDQFLKLIKK